jgi:uncharacterized protein (DUF1697 family)
VTRYACLLRGVNVSGARKVKMIQLRDLCVSIGYSDVETYLQSGNILLSTRTAQSKIGPSLSEAISKEFGYTDVDVVVRTSAELESIIKGNPFLARGCDPSQLYVTFFAKDVKPAAVEAIGLDRFLPDEFAPGTKAVYVYCPTGYGRTKLNTGFFERKLGMHATARNWQSVNKLWEMASEKSRREEPTRTGRAVPIRKQVNRGKS